MESALVLLKESAGLLTLSALNPSILIWLSFQAFSHH
jgi:hypothetical protein